jgi:DNA-binding transcriptional ArsR family regulator
MDGDIDLAPVGALIGDTGRARILAALADGRALPASVLAGEAGVSASTASVHLAKLVAGHLLKVERHGRHRYYRLAGPQVATVMEAIAGLSPATPVRSLREGSRAQALRTARTCYDHLAGRLGTALMRSLLDLGAVAGGDGTFHPDNPGEDRLSAPGRDADYHLTAQGLDFLTGLGVTIPPGRRPLVRYCVDWSEQRHHLAGRLGAALLTHFMDAGWTRHTPSRAVRVTDPGRRALATHFSITF